MDKADGAENGVERRERRRRRMLEEKEGEGVAA